MSTTTAQPPAADGSQSIGATFVIPFMNSVRQVLGTMARIEAKVGKPYLKTDPHPSHDVSGIIGFSGGLTGSVVISFPRQTAVRIVEAFAGAAMEPGSAEFADAIGELANMIAGSAKKDLNSVASISVPSVIVGSGHTVSGLSNVPTIVLPCSTPVGDLTVEVSIKRQPKVG
jgi:chemotaxis protein CheX